MAARVGGRSVRGGVISRKGPREEGRGKRKRGRDREAWGRPRSKTETGKRKTARERMTAEEGCRHRGHDDQVSRNGDREKCCGDGRADRKDESEGWSIRSNEASEEETELEEMPTPLSFVPHGNAVR